MSGIHITKGRSVALWPLSFVAMFLLCVFSKQNLDFLQLVQDMVTTTEFCASSK